MDDARHLLGGYASVAESQQHIQLSTSLLSTAAFWIHQRQDAFNALINQRLPKTDLDCSGLDRSTSFADADTWAKRATCLHAETVCFCFSSDATSKDKYDNLLQRLEDWNQHKPDIFSPVFHQERDIMQGRHFPEICFLWDCCAFALSYHYLSMLLMTVYDPSVPKIGPLMLEGRKRIDVR
ncbi:hypothetical protein LTR67_001677 [Exophiala xenobiotica]